MSLHQKMDSDQVTQIEKEEAKKPRFNNFNADMQNLILNASATLPFETTAEPPAFLQKLLEEILTQKKIQHGRIAVVPNQSIVIALHAGMFLWDMSDLLLNLSIFFCECPCPGAFNTNQSKQLHVKVTEGQGLVKADKPKAVK